MKYPGSDALYGPIIDASAFVQCCAYSMGQNFQSLISLNAICFIMPVTELIVMVMQEQR